MNQQLRKAFLTLCVSAIVIGAAACSSPAPSSTGTGGTGSPGSTGGTGSGGPGGGMMGGNTGSGQYASVGERIFMTGVGGDGAEIPRSASGVAQGSLMMGGGGCASCHNSDGRGGTITMMGATTIDVPDITYDSLIGAGFTDTTIGGAIRDGLDESGAPLKTAMPRWSMSDADLTATIAYLKVLSAR